MAISNPRLFSYILEGIAWSLSPNELDRLAKLARAHYAGSALGVLETAVAKRRHSLAERDLLERSLEEKRAALLKHS